MSVECMTPDDNLGILSPTGLEDILVHSSRRGRMQRCIVGVVVDEAQ